MGKGKGKGKGKGTGKARPVRQELRSVVDEVFREAGEAPAVSKTGKAWVVPRRETRKNQRRQKKEQRSHFFGRGRQSEEAETPVTNTSVPVVKVPKRRKRRREEEDEEITSDECAEGDANTNAPKEEVSAGDDDESGDEESEEVVPTKTLKKKRRKGQAVQIGKVESSYVPPHLRAAGLAAAAHLDEAEARRQLQRIVNRVSEGNLEPSSKELYGLIRKLVAETGSGQAAEALLSVLLPAAVADPNVAVLVLGCHAALLTGAHVLYGMAFGGTLLVHSGARLQRCLESGHSEFRVVTESGRETSLSNVP